MICPNCMVDLVVRVQFNSLRDNLGICGICESTWKWNWTTSEPNSVLGKIASGRWILTTLDSSSYTLINPHLNPYSTEYETYIRLFKTHETRH